MDDFQLVGNTAAAMLASGADGLSPWVLSVLLLSLRMTVAVALSPALASYGLPVSVRLVLVFVLAALAQSASNTPSAPTIQSPEQFVPAQKMTYATVEGDRASHRPGASVPKKPRVVSMTPIVSPPKLAP